MNTTYTIERAHGDWLRESAWNLIKLNRETSLYEFVSAHKTRADALIALSEVEAAERLEEAYYYEPEPFSTHNLSWGE